jgi:hypothetical protein
MSTLKAKTIQPVSDSDTLVLRTGATDSLTVDTSGNTTIRGELIVDGINIGQGVGNYTTNTRVGVAALASTTTPAVIDPWNSAFGRFALNANRTGYYNTGIGGQSLQSTTDGFENTAVGLNSGINNVDGDYNTAIGSQAGPASGSLISTTCVGRLAVASASNSVALGFNASATEANSIYLGNSAVNALYMGNGSAVAPAYVARAYGFIPATVVTGSPQNASTTHTKNVSSIVHTTQNGYYQLTRVNFITPMTTNRYTVVGMARYRVDPATQALLFISPAYNSGDGKGAGGIDVNANTTTSFSYTIWDNTSDSAAYNHTADVHFVVIST